MKRVRSNSSPAYGGVSGKGGKGERIKEDGVDLVQNNHNLAYKG